MRPWLAADRGALTEGQHQTEAPTTTLHEGESEALAEIASAIPAGYVFVDIPDLVIERMMTELTAMPEWDLFEGISMHAVLNDDGTPLGRMMMMGLTPEAAALPGVEESAFSDMAGDNPIENVVLFYDDPDAEGKQWATWTDTDPQSPNYGVTFYASMIGNPIDGATFVVVGGPDPIAVQMFLMAYGLS